MLKINWITGGKVSENWAYGNNCRNLIKNLPEFQHEIDNMIDDNDFVVYFDPLLFYKKNKLFKKSKSIVRFGGIRPFKILTEKFKIFPYELIKTADHCVPVNTFLSVFVKDTYNYTIIPNGIDLDLFHMTERPKVFTIGFSGNIQTKDQIDWKGYKFVQESATVLKDELLTTKRSNQEILHKDMCKMFYSKVSCLVLPTLGEGCSNTIGEALACGVPVITTHNNCYHSELSHLYEVIYCERKTEDIIYWINILKDKKNLHKVLAENGRQFVESKQDIKKVAEKWSQMFKSL